MERLSRLKIAILAALAQSAAPSYTAALRSEVGHRLGEGVNRGALARALAELSKDDLILENRGGPAPHGGPARAFYRLSVSGREQLVHEMRAFTRLTHQRQLSEMAVAFLENPPPGSKVAEAKAYGVDLVRLARALVQSPQDRYHDAAASMNNFRRYVR